MLSGNLFQFLFSSKTETPYVKFRETPPAGEKKNGSKGLQVRIHIKSEPNSVGLRCPMIAANTRKHEENRILDRFSDFKILLVKKHT